MTAKGNSTGPQKTLSNLKVLPPSPLNLPRMKTAFINGPNSFSLSKITKKQKNTMNKSSKKIQKIKKLISIWDTST